MSNHKSSQVLISCSYVIFPKQFVHFQIFLKIFTGLQYILRFCSFFIFSFVFLFFLLFFDNAGAASIQPSKRYLTPLRLVKHSNHISHLHSPGAQKFTLASHLRKYVLHASTSVTSTHHANAPPSLAFNTCKHVINPTHTNIQSNPFLKLLPKSKLHILIRTLIW